MVTSQWIVRRAGIGDVAQVLASVRSLLRELSGNPDFVEPSDAVRLCERIVQGRSSGAIFVAQEPDSGLAGVLTLTVQEALRTGGPYAEIQELWVDPAYRSTGVGAALIQAAVGFCQEQAITVMEVGLPGESFPAFARTASFYENCGFTAIGPRKRKTLS